MTKYTQWSSASGSMGGEFFFIKKKILHSGNLMPMTTVSILSSGAERTSSDTEGQGGGALK